MNMLIVVATTAALVGAQPALAKGCIRGAMAGGVAGHYVGKGHGVMGAAAGCIAMRRHAAKQAPARKAAGR